MTISISLAAGLFLLAVLAFSISAICGGGAGLLIMPVLAALLPGAQVPAALSIGTATSSLSRGVVFFRCIRWDVAAWFIPAALPAVWAGARLLIYINPLYLEVMMGLFLIGNLPMIFRKENSSAEKHPQKKPVLLLIGFAAGFVSGLTGAVGLLFNRFYLRYGMSKEEIVATRAANELLLHLVKIALYASFGLIGSRTLLVGGIVAFAAVFSSVLMKWLLTRISMQAFKKIGYAAMVVSGVALFAGAFRRVVSQDNVALSYTPVSGGLETQLQWKRDLFSLEFEYDEGFEFEHKITMQELPASLRPKAKVLIGRQKRYMLEEVYGVDKHYYELYVFTASGLKKYDLK
ncbi:MAG: sulfite exporter TauE/SafE family protein [Mucilaginibacter polytrichastri]|nr:sulfite exporter TauE/SafE family protein [Mucilaginibacter polytrichastri]